MSEELNQETPTVESCCKATEKKTNINLIISIVLGIAVIVLFVLHFKGAKDSSSVITAASTQASGKIAYINADSILSQYAMAKEIKAQLEDKIKKVQNELSTREQSFQKRVADFQKKLQAKSITQEQAQKTNEQLTQEKQSLEGLSGQYQQLIGQQQQELTIALHDTITNYLKRFNKDKKFDYILNYRNGGDLLYQNPGFDITNTVVKGLNEDYKKNNQGKK
jgi:outer membrane protein